MTALRTSLALVLAALAALAAAPVASAGLFKAIQDDETIGESRERADVIRQFVNLGATVQRIDLKWIDVAPEAPAPGSNPRDPANPAYDWSKYDEYVGLAGAYGLKVHFSVYRTPPWANGGQGTEVPPTRKEDYGDFLEAAARHFALAFPGVVRIYEIWNEPNGVLFFGNQKAGKGAPVRYADLVQETWNAIKVRAGITDVQIAAGSFQPGGTDVARDTAPALFLQRMRTSDGRRPQFDLVSVHSYALTPLGKRRDPPRRGQKDYRPFQADFGALPDFVEQVKTIFPGKPIYLSEFAWITKKNRYVFFQVAPAAQGTAIARSVEILAGYPQIVGFMQYQLRDQRPTFDAEGLPVNWSSGLQFFDGTPKSGEAAYRDALRGLAVGERPPVADLAPVLDAGPRRAKVGALGVTSPNGDGVLDGAVQVRLVMRRPTAGTATLVDAGGRTVGTLASGRLTSRVLAVDAAALKLGDGVYRVRVSVPLAPRVVTTKVGKGRRARTVRRRVGRGPYVRETAIRVDTTPPAMSGAALVAPATITPNADGADDAQLISFPVTEQGFYSVKVVRLKPDGTVETVRALIEDGTYVDPKRVILRWDGTDAQGLAAGDGVYFLLVTGEDNYGNTATDTLIVAVEGGAAQGKHPFGR